MLSKDKLILYCDRAITFCLYSSIFYLPFSIAGFEISIWTGFGLWTIKRFLGYRTDGLLGLIPETKLNKALIVFFLINALSVVFSMYLKPSFRALWGKEFKFLIIFFMIVETISNEKRLRNMMYVIMFSSFLMILDTFVQETRGVDFLRNHVWSFADASFGTPNDYGGWLIVIIPLLGGLLLSKSKVWLSGWTKIILAVLVFLLLGCLLLTYSRGAWAGLFIGCLMGVFYFVWKIPVKTRTNALLISIFVFLAFVVSYPCIKPAITLIGAHKFKTGERLKDRIRVIGNSWDTRMQLWKEAISIIKDHPLLGTGLNTYAVVIRSYKTFYFGEAYAHNSYLQMAAETGVLGLLSFLWVLFEYFKNCFRHLRQCQCSMVLGLMCGILAFLAQSFVDTNLQALQLVALFWFMSGLTFAVIYIECSSRDF